MGLKRAFFLGCVFSLSLVVACGSFPYKWYTMDLDDECYSTGMLRGPDPKDDLSMVVCAPSQQNQAPCIAMLLAEFEKLKAERDALLERLKACEENDDAR